jgi:hypothetical protein
VSPELDAIRNRVVRAIDARLIAFAESIDPSASRTPAAVDETFEAAVRLLQQQLAGVDRMEAESYGRVAALVQELEPMLGRLAAT